MVRYGFGKLPQVQFVQALPIRKTRAGLQLSCAAPVTLYNKASKALEMTDLWVANSDGYVGQICILTLHPEPAITSCNGVCNSRITCIVSVPPPCYTHLAGTAYHSDSFPASHDPSHHPHPHLHSLGYESEDDFHRPKLGHKASGEHWSVWLGTEDGSLHVYDCNDSVRVKKNRHKVQHKAPLNCMVYFERRVFVALGNGDVAVYVRNPNGKGWLVNEATWVTIGSAMNPVTKMICVHAYIWCACGSQIKVYGENGGMLELLQTIQVVIDGNQMPRGISAMVAADQQVWIAVQGSSIIKCYSTVTYECLSETNVAPEVAKILAGCDDIIRQHKSACLRVTALLVAPDKSLWIGTSAGVLLTINSSGQNPKIAPLCHGHTGQVRFLTCCVTRDSWTVISGGDGYEEFRAVPSFLSNSGASFSSMVTGFISDSSGDLSGREDSTNHLLIWKIPKLI
ncbi:Rho guanine nucleotide exchange factor 17 [Orchesella cincta]|uniref:Rho guanine nucleotide exchange factor 17 n=1 Tax=Orchesella cincta TaxID=48709 RepID=A0A1D2NMS7_ORCCI|nr:Rho guanine nucleotide exchange factor 17 [Orchesella cincta]